MLVASEFHFFFFSTLVSNSMGAASSVEFIHGSSSDSQDLCGRTDASSISSLRSSFLRRRALSMISDAGSRRVSNVSARTTMTEHRAEPVRPNVLNVPVYDRHPFSDYKFQKKLGE